MPLLVHYFTNVLSKCCIGTTSARRDGLVTRRTTDRERTAFGFAACDRCSAAARRSVQKPGFADGLVFCLTVCIHTMSLFISHMNPQAERLCLAQTSLTDEQLVALLPTLRNMPHLREVDLSGNQLSDQAMAELQALVTHHGAIRSIELCGNAASDVVTYGVHEAAACNDVCARLRSASCSAPVVLDLSPISSCASLRRVHAALDGVDAHQLAGVSRLAYDDTLVPARFRPSDEAEADAHVALIASLLPRLPHLIEISLAGVPLDGPLLNQLALAVQGNRHVRMLCLDDASSHFDVAALVPAVRAASSQLETFALVGCSTLTRTSLQPLADALCACRSLTSLNLARLRPMSGDTGAFIAEIVAALPRLSSLSLCSNRLDSVAALRLAGALHACPNLAELDLRNNFFGDEAARALVASLAANCKRLADLRFAASGFGDQAAQLLASSLAAFPHLSCLSLYNNSLAHDGAVALAAALMHSPPALVSVNVARNPIGKAAAAAFASALPHTGLITFGMDVVFVDPSQRTLLNETLAWNTRLARSPWTFERHARMPALLRSVLRTVLIALRRPTAVAWLGYVPLELIQEIFQYIAATRLAVWR